MRTRTPWTSGGFAWNVSEAEGHRRLRRRLVAIAAGWVLAFAVVVLGTFASMGAAEAAPIGRLAAASGAGLPLFLTGLLGGAGSLTALLWARLLAPGRITRSRRVR